MCIRDRVKLDGKGFKSFVKSGQEVKAGDKLVEFDIDLIKKEGCSPDVMVVVLEAVSYTHLDVYKRQVTYIYECKEDRQLFSRLSAKYILAVLSSWR